MTQILQGIPLETDHSDWNKAAGLLEQAVRVGNRDAAAAYLLAMCYKRLGRTAAARTALSRIAEPDANVHLQRGLLAHADKDFALAEARAAGIEAVAFGDLFLEDIRRYREERM